MIMRKHRPRKELDPMGWISKRTAIAADQQRDLGIAYHVSLQAMLSGHGTEESWSTVTCSLNIALILAEQGFCAGAIPTIKLAQEAMLRSQERALRTGKWAFDGTGMQSVMAALNIHDEQIARASRAQISGALREVHRRIESNEYFLTTTAAHSQGATA
jgi:hypothetical protein